MLTFFFAIPSWILWVALLLFAGAMALLGSTLAAVLQILTCIAAFSGILWLIQALRGKEESATLWLWLCGFTVSPWVAIAVLRAFGSLVSFFGSLFH